MQNLRKCISSGHDAKCMWLDVMVTADCGLPQLLNDICYCIIKLLMVSHNSLLDGENALYSWLDVFALLSANVLQFSQAQQGCNQRKNTWIQKYSCQAHISAPQTNIWITAWNNQPVCKALILLTDANKRFGESFFFSSHKWIFLFFLKKTFKYLS